MQVVALTLLVKVVVFGAAVLALVATGHPRLAVLLGAAAVLSSVLSTPRRRCRSPQLTWSSRPQTKAARTPAGQVHLPAARHPGVDARGAGQRDDVVEDVLPDAEVPARSPAAPGTRGPPRCSLSTEPPGPSSTSQ